MRGNMKKLVTLLITLVLFFTIPGFSLAQTPIQPGVNMEIDVSQGNAWFYLRGNVVNRVGLVDENGVRYKKFLDVGYSFAGKGRLSGWGSQEWENTRIYSLDFNTNYPELNTSPYATDYYLLVDSEDKTINIAYSTNSTVNISYSFWKDNDPEKIWRLKETDPKPYIDGRYNWVGDYFKQILSGVKAGRKIQESAPTEASCEEEFQDLNRVFNNFWSLVEEFGENKDNKYFRGKNAGEKIVDSLLPYTNAFKHLIAADPIGAFTAFTKTYIPEDVVFEPAGQQKLDEAKEMAVNASNIAKSLEEKCRSYIDDSDNYPMIMRGINPDLKKELEDWGAVKEQVTSLEKFAEILGAPGFGEPVSATDDLDWLGNVLNFLVKLLSPLFEWLLKWVIALGIVALGAAY